MSNNKLTGVELIARLKKTDPHILPYNLGDMGETHKTIQDTIKFLESLDAQSSNADQQTPSYEGEQVEAIEILRQNFDPEMSMEMFRKYFRINRGDDELSRLVSAMEDFAAKKVEAYASSKQVKGEQPANKMLDLCDIAVNFAVALKDDYKDSRDSLGEIFYDWKDTLKAQQLINQLFPTSTPSTDGKLYRTVKASERLPEKSGMYICITMMGGVINLAHFPAVQPTDFSHIREWLEEVKPGEQREEEEKPWHDLEVEPYAFWDGKQKMPLFLRPRRCDAQHRPNFFARRVQKAKVNGGGRAIRKKYVSAFSEGQRKHFHIRTSN